MIIKKTHNLTPLYNSLEKIQMIPTYQFDMIIKIQILE